ncbi:MAG: prepilin-type N-terminal cleavage/methylation domain-containing protein [Phycisphaerales bacterium]|jgi:type II secretion system protein G|nr:prepilin-type N-terminal cleavage/methylation domain-containing protein [Phycisphaerales bacterium]
MNKRRNSLKRGFTLIEILIVVVILGILAAIIIPQFTDAAQDAGASSARSQLQTMRSQIELYRVQNNGATPDDDGGNVGPWVELVTENYIRSAPNWPNGFVSVYNATTGDLTLTFDLTQGPSPDLDGDNDGDAADVTIIEGW